MNESSLSAIITFQPAINLKLSQKLMNSGSNRQTDSVLSLPLKHTQLQVSTHLPCQEISECTLQQGLAPQDRLTSNGENDD